MKTKWTLLLAALVAVVSCADCRAGENTVAITSSVLSQGTCYEDIDELNWTRYNVTVPVGKKVTFTFTLRGLSSYQCDFPYVDLSTGQTGVSGTSSGKHCRQGDTFTRTFTSGTWYVYVSMHSDWNLIGFKRNFYALGVFDVSFIYSDAVTYTVSFDANGGTVTPSSRLFDAGAKYLLPTPSYDGHVFDGWYTSKTGGTKVTPADTVSKSTTLYAHWTKRAELYPSAMSGLSRPLVVGTSSDPSSDAATLKASNTLYVKWSAKCSGTKISTAFKTKLYVDDVLKHTWNTTSAVAANSYIYGSCSIGTLAAGSHTLKLVVDSEGNVTEADETNNTYVKTIYVSVVKPNLAFKTYTSWPKKLWFGTSASTLTEKTEFEYGETIYLYNCYKNTGEASAPAHKVYHEVRTASGTLVESLTTEHEALGAGSSRRWDGKVFSILQGLPVGSYVYKCRLDSGYDVSESNEDDNIKTYAFTIKEPPPVLNLLGPSSVASGMSYKYECIASFYDRIEKVSATWTLPSGGEYATIVGGKLQAGVTLTDRPVTIKAKYTYKGVTYSIKKNIYISAGTSLAEALDNDSLTFKTSGDSPWFGQAGGVARSGALGNSQTNYIKTTVMGPGRISFLWKASCEARYDLLSFLVDGVTVEKTSDTNSVYTAVSYEIPEGEHKLKWQYSKDSGVARGEDCGYLMQVDYKQYPLVHFRDAGVTVSEKAEYVDLVVKCRRPTGKMRPYDMKNTGQIFYRDDAHATYSTMDGSGTELADARADEDYEVASGTLHWNEAGDEADRVIRVKLLPELVEGYQGNRRFRVKLANANGSDDYTIIGTNDICTVKIKEKDAYEPGRVRVTVLNPEVDCGGVVTARVERVGGDDGRMAVTVKTKNDTAHADVEFDYALEECAWEDGDITPRYVTVVTREYRADDLRRFRIKTSSAEETEIENPNVYITIRPRPSAVVKKSFTVTGPGIFTAVPVASGTYDALKYKIDGGSWICTEEGERLNLVIPEGIHTVAVKLSGAQRGAELEFEPQLRGGDYWLTPLTNIAYAGIDGNGRIVDSKGRLPLVKAEVKITRGVYLDYPLPGLAVDDVPELAGGSIPAGLTLDAEGRRICGRPYKTKNYAAVLRIRSGTNKKRIVYLTFWNVDDEDALGTYYGVLSDGSDAGWIKFTAGTDGVSAKVKVGGVTYRFAAPGLDSIADGCPEIRMASEEGTLSVAGGVAALQVNGLGEWTAELYRAATDVSENAGYYTFALRPDSAGYGNGYLTMTVDVNGSAVYAGRLPDGSEFSGSSIVGRTAGGICMPFSLANLFGRLKLSGSGDESFAADSTAVWYPAGTRRIGLRIQGGRYNTLYNLQRYYHDLGGETVRLEAESAPEALLYFRNNELLKSDAVVTSVNFNRATGVVDGKFRDASGAKHKFYAINLLTLPAWQDDLSQDVFATGLYLRDDGTTVRMDLCCDGILPIIHD